MLVPKNEKGGAACIFKICCCGGQVFGKYRFDGSCNDLDTQMRACTKAERIERTTIHRQEAKEKRAAIAKKVAEQSKAGVDWREELKKKINE